MTASPKRALALPPDAATTIAYVRVSTEDQAHDDKASLADQERECRAFTATRHRAVDFVWSDPGVSGRDEERLERLTRWCEAHPRPKSGRGLIVVLNASRWGRFVHNANASAFYEYRLGRVRWDVEFVQQPATGNRTTDGVLKVIHSSQAAAESEEKAYRAHSGMLGQAKLGRWLGRAPFGYARVATAEGGKKRRLDPFEHSAAGERVQLVPGNPRDVRTIELIFRRYVEGATFPTIAAELNEGKVPGPFDVYRNRGNSKRWRGCTLRAILFNPAYAGDQIWNRRQASEVPEGPRPVRDKSEWVTVESAHPPLVTRATFAAAQARLHRKGKRQRLGVAQPYLLSGLVKCATCDSLVVGGGGTRRNAPDPGAFKFYRCQGGMTDKHDAPPCPPPLLTVNQRWLEGEVIGRVAGFVVELVASGALAAALDRALGTQGPERSPRLQLERERSDLEAKRDRIVDALGDGVLSKAAAKTKLADIEAGLSRVDRELQELRLEPTRADRVAERDRLLKLAADFPTVIRRAPPALARELLGYWVAAITLDKIKREGRLALRRLPAAGRYSVDSPVRPAAGRRCWRGDSRRFSPA